MDSSKFKMLIQEVDGTYPLLEKICRKMEEGSLKNFDFIDSKISFKFNLESNVVDLYTRCITSKYTDFYVPNSLVAFYISYDKSGYYINNIILILSDNSVEGNIEIQYMNLDDLDVYINKILRQQKIKLLK